MKLEQITETMGRPYYVLAIKDDDGVWVMEFGDYDRQTVKDEALDHSDHGVVRRRMKIIRTGDNQEAIDASISRLNDTQF